MKGFLSVLLFVAIYAGYLLFTHLLFGDDNLISVKGKPTNRNIIIKKEAVKPNDSIHIAVFTFRLMGNKKFFNLKMNIENMHQGFNVFGGVNKTLSEAGEVTVSIRKGEANENIPKVYKIVADEEIIYELKKKPGENAKIFIALLFISFAGFAFFLLINRPKIEGCVSSAN